MGLTFHYSGRFKKNASLKEMISEVKDVAEIYKWDYHVFEESFPDTGFNEKGYNQKMYGICFAPPECETVWLSFLSNGRMSSSVNLEFYGKSKNKKEYLYSLFVKTQYAGIEIHKILIHLFKYLNRKYFDELIVNDEGEYWETGDEKLLEEIFSRYNFIVNGFISGLENYPIEQDESFEDYFLRVMRYVHAKVKR